MAKPDLICMVEGIFESVEWKITIFLFFICIIVLSDLFNDHVLSRFDGATSDGVPTTKGSLIQIGSILAGYNAFNLVVKSGYV